MTKPKKKRVGRRILSILLVLLLLAAAAFVGIPMTETVSVKTVPRSADWMADLDDGLRLNEIVLPGAHDAATQFVQLAFFSKCQALSIGEQLEAGVRYLDIRLGPDDSRDMKTWEFKLMHGFTSCKISPLPWDDVLYLDAVLAQCYAFLKVYPTETLVFAVKQEHGSESVAEFQTQLNQVLEENREMWLLTDELPTLGEARGKLVLLRRYEDEAGLGADAGIPLLWPNQNGHEDVSKHAELTDNGACRLWVQDRYEYGTKDKWTAFCSGLKEPGIEDGDLSIHFLSTKGTLPYGHPYYFARSLNAKLMDLPPEELRGWIIVDFADAALAEHIWSANFD